ncbi:MAG: hypothetical protein ABSG78_12680 [Verrucomicrobiota bacterium]|jgi:hypothetical protein
MLENQTLLRAIAGKHSELDQITCCDFIWGLPEDASRQIHAYLHRLQHGLESRFDPAAHLRACEEHLEYDWHYGQALIEECSITPGFCRRREVY